MTTNIEIKGVAFSTENISGTIIHVKEQVITKTHISGGGGSVSTGIISGNVSGRIRPVESSNETTITQEIHYKYADDGEDYIRLKNHNLPLRDGQEFEFLRLMADGGYNEVIFLKIINLNRKFQIGDTNDLIERVYKAKYGNRFRFISLGISALLVIPDILAKRYSTVLFVFGLLFLITYSVFKLITKPPIRKAVRKTVSDLFYQY